MTVGITPTSPSTAFGYVRVGESLEVNGAPSARRVVEFVEKPDAARAAQYLAGGEHRWNAGMFVARADVLLAELARSRPALHDGVQEIAAAWDSEDRDAVLGAVWPQLERVAIDYAVAEPAAEAGRVAVIPADLGWDDVGGFDALADLVPPSADGGPRVLGDGAQVLADDDALVVAGSGRLIAVLGVPDVVVVDTPDALLVTTRDRAQDVKGLVERVRALGRDDLV